MQPNNRVGPSATGSLGALRLDNLLAHKRNPFEFLRRGIQKITDSLERRDHVFEIVDLPFRDYGVPAALDYGNRFEDPLAFSLHPLGKRWSGIESGNW